MKGMYILHINYSLGWLGLGAEHVQINTFVIGGRGVDFWYIIDYNT